MDLSFIDLETSEELYDLLFGNAKWHTHDHEGRLSFFLWNVWHIVFAVNWSGVNKIMCHIVLKFLNCCQEYLDKSTVNLFHVVIQRFVSIFFVCEYNETFSTRLSTKNCSLDSYTLF